MKVHEYVCNVCNRRFESFVRSDDHEVRCCGKQARKVISSPAFKLPGHTDDFPSAHRRWVKEHEDAGRTP